MSDRARTADENAASLRINASLDLETVLNEVVESARALTGAIPCARASAWLRIAHRPGVG